MIYSKTETGQQVVKDRSVPLTPRQRSAFILFDGKRTVDGVLAATAGMGVTAEDIQFMADSGLLAVVEGLLRLRPRPPRRPRRFLRRGESPAGVSPSADVPEVSAARFAAWSAVCSAACPEVCPEAWRASCASVCLAAGAACCRGARSVGLSEIFSGAA